MADATDLNELKIGAIYARRSRDDPARVSSIPDQIERDLELARREGIHVPKEYIFVDDDISGAELYRPDLIKVQDLARAKAIKFVVMRDMERFSRDLRLCILVSEELKRHGARLLFTDHDYENTPEGDLSFHMRGAFSQYERAKILQRLRWGMERRAKEGKPILGTIPLGYHYENGSLEIDKNESSLVERIFNMYLDGKGTWLIAKQLTADGVLTKYDRDPKGHHKRRPVGVWGVSSKV